MTRVLIAVAGIAAAAILFLVLRPDDDDDGAASPPPPPPPPATTATGSVTVPVEPPPPQPPPKPKVARVNIVVRGGRPVGGIRRATVARNRRVILTVRSDVSDHVHLHGYNVMRDVGPGMAARIDFRATIPGRFEVELEDRRLQIADITVNP
jgi:hypothetical protein